MFKCHYCDKDPETGEYPECWSKYVDLMHLPVDERKKECTEENEKKIHPWKFKRDNNGEIEWCG